MIKRNYLGTSILILALAMTASAAASAANSRRLALGEGAMLKGTHLDAGEYTIRWESHSAEATVTITKKKNVIATVEAQLVRSARRGAVPKLLRGSPLQHTPSLAVAAGSVKRSLRGDDSLARKRSYARISRTGRCVLCRTAVATLPRMKSLTRR